MKTSNQNEFDVIVVGAGPAGLGVGIVLKKLDINYLILEKHSVGASFKNWPKETRLISPSFTGNSFKMPDLNAISPDTSPAFSLLTEHPSGKEYAQYLNSVSDLNKLSIQNNVEVKNIEKDENFFIIKTSNGEYNSKIVIWAAGEFQYPRKGSFEGDHLCTHYSTVKSFANLDGEDFIIIGAYEAGFDSAVNLAKLGKNVTILDSDNFLEYVVSDSSYSLSPFTRDRIKDVLKDIKYHKKTKVKKVELDEGKYIVTTTNKEILTSNSKPINCTGFDSSLILVKDLFEFKEGFPLLNNYDESTKTSNLFLVGPKVKHESALLCFIYKFRQRFAIVAERIANQLNISSEKLQEVIKEYKDNNFYLKDLSSCEKECSC